MYCPLLSFQVHVIYYLCTATGTWTCEALSIISNSQIIFSCDSLGNSHTSHPPQSYTYFMVTRLTGLSGHLLCTPTPVSLKPLDQSQWSLGERSQTMHDSSSWIHSPTPTPLSIIVVFFCGLTSLPRALQ